MQVMVAPLADWWIPVLDRADSLLVWVADNSISTAITVAEALHAPSDGRKDIYELISDVFNKDGNHSSFPCQSPVLQSTLRKSLFPPPADNLIGVYIQCHLLVVHDNSFNRFHHDLFL